MERAMAMTDGTVGGYILDGDGLREGHAVVSQGTVSLFDGPAEDADIEGIIVPGLVNCHTHCADYGLTVPEGMGLKELVAPPDGLKHRYLAEASRDELRSNMSRFAQCSADFGTASFVDFREGGAEGCRLLREACPGAVIMGRPISPEFDPNEITDILAVADGIGLPSISDMDAGYLDAIADATRSAGRPLAIHVSELTREDIDEVLSLDPAFIVHMCAATDSDMAKCAEAEVPVVVCPRSNSFFGIDTPIRRLISNGVEVLLGTDNGMLCQPDMFAYARALTEKLVSQGGDPSLAWDVLGACCGKILNCPTYNMVSAQTVPCALLSMDDVRSNITLSRYSGNGVRLGNRIRWSEIDGFREDTRSDRWKRIHKGRG